MSVHRFTGANSRDAMRQVRATLGEDALILSNRRVEDGVEVLALANDEHERLTAGEVRDVPAPRVAAPLQPGAPSPSHAVAETGTAVSSGPLDFAALSERLLGEMQGMREMLSRQPGSGTQEALPAPGVMALRQRLLQAGFGPRLVLDLLETLPTEMGGDAPRAGAWLERQLAARLPVLDDEAALLDRGGVFALVGPTGVGKTTTTAKLAARYVMRHGGTGVALVTTDSYRIGAHEQLRIYARLLGVEVHALQADAPLGGLLDQLADKKLVIIDTVGMSQRDQRLAGQIARLGGGSRPVRRLLLLNAASHGDTLEDVMQTYQEASREAGTGLDGCILTKVDEAPRLGAVLDTVMRHGLRVLYVSHGQQVPEDLRLAEREGLLRQALAVHGDSPFALDTVVPREQPVAGRKLQALTRGLLGQGRALAATLDILRREVSGFANLEWAWQLTGKSSAKQASGMAELLDPVAWAADGQGRGDSRAKVLLWPRLGAPSGSTWQLPALALDRQGIPLTFPWLMHRLPAGELARLLDIAHQQEVDCHLLPACPGRDVRRHLAGLTGECPPTWWLASAKGNTRVTLEGERHMLSALGDEVGEQHEALTCRYRGRTARLVLRTLGVKLADGQPVRAWWGDLTDSDSGQWLAQRYWLSPVMPGRQDEAFQQRAICHQLAQEEQPALIKRAWQRVADRGHAPCDPELQLLLAGALAAVASRLDQENSEWALDVRAQLLGLLGGRRSRSAVALLEALVQLLTACDAFRDLGGAGLVPERAI
ncbi:flagellar biosynthesis protein FlhF [Halomonas shantousis]